MSLQEEQSVYEDVSRQEAIHNKGFNMNSGDQLYYRNFATEEEAAAYYNKIKVGPKTLDDAVLKLGSYSKNVQNINKGSILTALSSRDNRELRRISNFFYNTNGIYMRACNYFAQLYRYDWYIEPDTNDNNYKPEKITQDFIKVSRYFDNSYIKKICGDIALKVIKDGCYYGYITNASDRIVIQELPINYCRSRYNIGNSPAIEFNMSFFDDKFADINYRMKVLKMFPEEFAKGYMLYKQNKLVSDDWTDLSDDCKEERRYSTGLNDLGRRNGWYLLDPALSVKFNLNNSDTPIFASVIPNIIDLDEAQDLDRRKQMQQLLKILIQKLPMDKNGDLIFDIDEARDIHNNAVQMLKRAIGVDVLTTFADIESINMSDKTTTATQDDLEKVERSVYNAFGISRNLFNTNGNLSLEKSILDDESTMRNLLFQFDIVFDRILQRIMPGSKKKYTFNFHMLETTQYNYKEMSKLFKEQTQLGFSKVLPQIALGISQSSILNTVFFETNILHLTEIMLPPLMSSTMSSQDVLGTRGQSNQNKNQQNTGSNDNSQAAGATNPAEQKGAGRPAKADDEKSEKTIQNLESQS